MLKREHVIVGTRVVLSNGLSGIIDTLSWPKFTIAWTDGATTHYRLGDCPLEDIQRIAEE